MTLYMWGLPKDQLRNEEVYTHCAKEKIEQGEKGWGLVMAMMRRAGDYHSERSGKW